jgi:carbonic anhydrase
MRKLIKGIHQFRSEVFLPQKELFDRLAKEQAPDALFITCSDSRINPNLITQTDPGDIFVLRNAGNIVPPHGAGRAGGEAATIEFAIVALGVKDVIVCGHLQCGAMTGLFHPENLEKVPAMKEWLQHAESTRRIVLENYEDLEDTSRVDVAVQENVLVQLENLRTHPAVAARIARGQLNLHGWVYDIKFGEVYSYTPSSGQFLPILEVGAPELRNSGKHQTIVPI